MELVRNCPTCQQEIHYKYRHHHAYGVEHNVKCKRCRGTWCKGCGGKIQKNKKTGYCLACYQSIYLPSVRLVDTKDSSSWKRDCPQCGNEIIYSTYEGFYGAIKHNRLCQPCGSRKKERQTCNGCQTELTLDNTSGYCGTCYTEKVKQEAKQYRTYECGICHSTTVFKQHRAVKDALVRGCCVRCHQARVKENPRMVTVTCMVCQNPFETYYKHPRKTCSDTCLHSNKGGVVKSNTGQFAIDSKVVHGDLYDYSKVEYQGTLKKVVIGCKKHGDFLQYPQDHLTGSGCSKCKASHGERRIRLFLEKHGITHHPQHKFSDCINPMSGRKLSYDYYLPSLNMVIEYDGEQHFRIGQIRGHMMTMQDLLDIQSRDNVKTKYATDKKLHLVRINYKQLDQIEKLLETSVLTQISR